MLSETITLKQLSKVPGLQFIYYIHSLDYKYEEDKSMEEEEEITIKLIWMKEEDLHKIS